MKITKSELREMIRECLREELNRAKLKEDAFSGGVAGDNRSGSGKISGCGGSTSVRCKKTYLRNLKDKNPKLVDIITIKVKDLKPNMMTQAGQVEKLTPVSHSGENYLRVLHTNGWDDDWRPEDTVEVMADPNDRSKPSTVAWEDLLDMGLKPA